MKRWRITFNDGSSELTPDNADMVRAGKDGILRVASSRMYGPDETVASYPLTSVRKWEVVDG